MECAICYEKFFIPNTQEEFEQLYKENVKNYDYDEIMKFENLLITPSHNATYACPTPNCKCVICGDCLFKITHKGKGVHEMTDDEIQKGMYDYFECPYCRQIDWKNYMNNVFDELEKKILGEKEFIELMFKKSFLLKGMECMEKYF